jgi:hypothetical protein
VVIVGLASVSNIWKMMVHWIFSLFH